MRRLHLLRIYMKSIQTLVKDLYDTASSEGWFTPDLSGEFHLKLSGSLNQTARVPSLRLSQMGTRCPCHLWHSIHSPSLREPLPAWARIKYDYGHIIEAYVICLAKASGHEVTGEQDELTVDGVVGHRDCVIDGNIVDVKSTTTRGFQKFKDGSIRDDDPFGYLDQLDGYVLGSRNDPLVRNKSSGYLLAIDKQLGHICLYEHKLREDHVRQRIKDYREIVARPEPPACTCGTVADGKSGNIKLDTRASYSPFKYCCKPNLRTFLYATGPVYLTHVARKPDVVEVDRNGKIILR